MSELRRPADDPNLTRPETEKTTAEALRGEAYTFNQGADGRPAEVARTSDRAQIKELVTKASQEITADLTAAKTNMVQLNEIVRQKGSAYEPNGQINAAYKTALENGEKGYLAARDKADALLFEVERGPNGQQLKRDADGRPIESQFSKALKQERAQLNLEIEQLKTQTTNEARALLAQKMQERANISDLLRMAGYARANHGLGLMFACAHLREPDKDQVKFAATRIIRDANVVDPLTDLDPNFRKHEANAWKAAGGRPGDTAPANPGTVADTRPKGTDQPPGTRVDQPLPAATTAKDIPGIPGAKYDEVAKRLIKDTNSLPSGTRVLEPAKDAQQRVLATDGKPILDSANNYRVGPDGLPLSAALAGDDPRTKIRQAEAGVTGAFKPENHAAYKGAIEAADALDRVSMLKRLADNQAYLEKVSKPATIYIQQDVLRGALDQLAGPLDDKSPMFAAFDKMYREVKTPPQAGQASWAAMDAWLAKPENIAHKAALESHPKWAQIKPVFGMLVGKNAEADAEPGLQGNKSDLTKNPTLAAEVNEARRRMAESDSLDQLYRSSLSTRIAYLEKLCAQDDVKAFMALPADQKQTNALKDNPQVKAAQDMIRELASQERMFVDTSPTNPIGQNFVARAGMLGVTRFDTPAAVVTPGTRPGGDQLPTTRPGGDQPSTTRPAAGDAPRITPAQENAIGVAAAARTSLMQKSENGSKKIPDDQFKPIEEQFQKALADATSVKPEQLQALTADLNKSYRDALAAQQNKPDLTVEQADQIRLKSSLDLKAANDRVGAAILALPPADRTRFEALQTKFDADQKAKTEAVQKTLDAELAKFPAGTSDQVKSQKIAELQRQLDTEIQQLATKLIDDKKAFSPEIKAAIEAQLELLNKPETALAINHANLKEAIERLQLAPDLVRMYYAEALAVQGQIPKAKELLEAAVKNSKVVQALCDNTVDGSKLATKLGVKTPNFLALEAEAARLFPENKRADDALALMEAAKGKTPAEKKTAFEQACKLFDEALALTDREGDDARKVEDLRATANALKLRVDTAEKNIKEGKQTDFTEAELVTARDMQIASKQAENVALMRYKYALMLNEYGHDNNDNAAKEKAKQVLNSIKDVDPTTFAGSPELQGALKQANEGKRIDSKTVASEAYFTAAQNTLIAHGSGLSDWMVPGASSIANGLSGNRAATVPIIGPTLFGGGPEVNKKVIDQLAAADLANRLATEQLVAQAGKNGNTALRDVGTDVLAIGSGFGVRGLLRTDLASKYVSKLGTPGKIAAVALPFAAAGLVKDYSADGQLGQSTDWLRGAGGYTLSLGAIKMLAANPTKAALSAETVGATGTRFGVEGLAAGNSQQLGKALWAHRDALKEVVAKGALGTADDAAKLAAQDAAGKLAMLEAQLGGFGGRAAQRFNPLNYTGLQWQGGLKFNYVGFGGERAAAALGNGTMSYGEFAARRFAGNFLNVGGTAFAFGAGREGMYIGTGKTRADGTPHDLNSAIKEMATAGGQTTLAATVMLPMAGGFVRSVGGGKLLDGSGRMISNRLTGLGMSEAGVVGLGNLSLIGAQPVLSSVETYNQGTQLQAAYKEARQMADEAREKARKELEAKEQQQKAGQRK